MAENKKTVPEIASKYFRDSEEVMNKLALGVVAFNSTAITLTFSTHEIFGDQIDSIVSWFVWSIFIASLVRFYRLFNYFLKLSGLVKLNANQIDWHIGDYDDPDEADRWYADHGDPGAEFRLDLKDLESQGREVRGIRDKCAFLALFLLLSFMLFLKGIWVAANISAHSPQVLTSSTHSNR